MACDVVLAAEARRHLRKLDQQVARRVVAYLAEVAQLDAPRTRGKGLVGDRAGIWRYRVGDYRVLCEIQDRQLVVLVLEVGNRGSLHDG